MRLRTITMIIMMVICGLGIGLFAGFRDGLYTAIFLFMFPVFTALMFLFISIDIANPPKVAAPREADERSKFSTRERKPTDGAMHGHHPARI